MNRLTGTLAITIATVLYLAHGLVAVYAQSANSDNTYRLDDVEKQPQATLDDVSWLVGSWVGDAFGDSFEEVWNPPSAGTMVGMFKLFDEGTVSFYELMLLAEEGGSLNLKVKHFNSDFSAWEEKKDHVTFRLVKVEEDAVHFSGLSFYRVSDNEIHGYLVLHDEGKQWEEKLVYRRSPL